jgi:trehalose 6-phosphate phosphatase
MTDVRETMCDPGELDANLRAAVTRIAATPTLLVALDFDGTLAPEVDDPQAARPIPSAAWAIRRLVTLHGTRVALVSGRGIASLEAVSDAPSDVLLVGSHGVEFHHDGHTELVIDPGEQTRLGALRASLIHVTADYGDVHLEDKPVGFAVHTRVATAGHAVEAVSRSITAALAAVPGVTIRHGKNVVEFSVRGTTKGHAIERLRQFTGATAVLFAGDDVTDEDAFSVLGFNDLSLKCGPGETQAEYRVKTPDHVAVVLHLLADVRARRAPAKQRG